MEENGNLVRFMFNQDWEAVTEEDNSGLNRLIRASELIAANSGADSARTYYHYASDEMGSTTHIVDEAGAVQNCYEYDAWGNITAQEEAIPNRFKFTGQQFDPVTQQYYLRARFYNPVVARFTQEDTYRGDGLNLYAYCESNPVFYADPDGNAARAICEAKADLYRKILTEGGELTSEQRKELKRYERLKDNLMYQAEAATGYSSAKIYNEAHIGDVSKLKVVAVYEQNGNKYMDVNPKARDSNYKTGEKITFNNNETASSPFSPGGFLHMDTTSGAHAEISAMQQAYAHGESGGSGSLTVLGAKVCNTCRYCNIPKATTALDLGSVTVHESKTNKNFTIPGR